MDILEAKQSRPPINYARIARKVRRRAKWVIIAYIIVMLVQMYRQNHVGAAGFLTHFKSNQYLVLGGLDPANSYPIQLGGPTTSELGQTATPHFYLLNGKEVVARGLQPSSEVRFLMQVGSKGYILQLPYSKAQFVKGDKASVKLKMSNKALGSVPFGTVYTFWNFLLLQDRIAKSQQRSITDSYEWRHLQRVGIGGLAQNQLRGATFTLPPKLYSKYFGGK